MENRCSLRQPPHVRFKDFFGGGVQEIQDSHGRAALIFIISGFLFMPLSASPFDWHLLLSESVHPHLNPLTLHFSHGGAAEISEVRHSISLKGNRTAVRVEAASSQA